MTEPTELMKFLSIANAIICTFACHNFAKKRNRNEKMWAVLGFFFNIFALLTLYFLSKKKKSIKTPIKETTGNISSAHNEAAEALNDDAFEMPKAPRLSSSKSLSWYYIDSTENDAIKGPISINELRKKIHHSKLDEATYIWCEEFEEWTIISEFSNNSLILDPDFIE